AVWARRRVTAVPALCVHAKLEIGPLDAVRFRWTSAPAIAVWSGPALATIGGGTTAMGTVMVPPPAEVTVTVSGGGLPGGRPTAALALPLPVDVNSLGTKPVPVAVRGGLGPTSLGVAGTTPAPPLGEIAPAPRTTAPRPLH